MVIQVVHLQPLKQPQVKLDRHRLSLSPMVMQVIQRRFLNQLQVRDSQQLSLVKPTIQVIQAMRKWFLKQLQFRLDS
jgi:hypothetical protein